MHNDKLEKNQESCEIGLELILGMILGMIPGMIGGMVVGPVMMRKIRVWRNAIRAEKMLREIANIRRKENLA